MSGPLEQVDGVIRLTDGRTVTFAEYGDPQGKPLMLFHGTPGSRLLNPASIFPAATGKRVIVADRPGYGGSSFHTRWGLLDWADDMAQLADALGIARWAVMGISGGGAYAAAFAYRFPQRVTTLTLLCSVGPFPVDREGEDPGDFVLDDEAVAARTLGWPGFLEWFRGAFGAEAPDVEEWIRHSPLELAERDRLVKARPEVQFYLRRLWGAAFAQGSMECWAYDSFLLTRPWGFDVRDIAVPSLLWHGEADQAVPVERGRYLAAAIPNCRGTFFPGEGHLFFHDHWTEIFAAQ